MPKFPTGPAGWRQLGLLALLALILLLLIGRGCSIEPSTAQTTEDGEQSRWVWQPEAALTVMADLFRVGPVEGKPNWHAATRRVVDGDPARGRLLAMQYGCGACHRAPDIGMARGRVGPDLTGFAGRGYIAGILTNRPGALVSWLRNPPAHAPQTAMPDMGIGARDARDLAAWLYTLDGA
jgi:cytochrome c2